MLLAILFALASALAPPTLTAARATDVRVDGVLDEAAWAAADVATDFVQFEPDEGAPSSERTEVRVLRTGDALVVGARLFAADPRRIRRTLSRRDDDGNADAFVAAFDSYDDGRTAYLFGVTAAGVQFDAFLEGSDDDASWDAVWRSAVRVTDDGWTVEMAIPYSQLRFSESSTSWGLNFQRIIPAAGEEAYWAPITQAETRGGLVRLFGRLDGMAGLSPRPVLQILPYTLAGVERSEDALAPGHGVNDVDGNAGADLKVGLSSNVTLDATINPDFGQVDADPAELNLSTFETFFSERRPFFIEGTQIFDLGFASGDGALLYTRRIGGASPIIAATKLTGRTSRGLLFGALASVTGDSFDPTRAYAAARVKQEFPGQSYLGAGLTAYDERDAIGDDVRAVAGAADWAVRLWDRQWQFEGTGAASLRDAGPDRTLGAATYIGLDKVEGYFTPGFGFRAYSDGFRLNDVGRFRQTDILQLRGGMSYLLHQGRPVGPFRRLRAGGFATHTWQLSDGLNRGLEVSTFGRGELLGFQALEVDASLAGIGGYDVRETRGLGPVRNVLRGGVSVEGSTDSRRPWQASAEAGVEAGADGGRGLGVGAGLDWAVSDRLALDVEVGLGVSDGDRAWAANEALIRTTGGDFIGATADRPETLTEDDLIPFSVGSLLDGLPPYAAAPLLIDGATGYYLPLFAMRDTREADLMARAQYIVGPTLSLQFYGQLFTARGRYRNFRFLTSPDTFADADAYPKRRDFAFSSLTTNTVLRWEYQPGSTLFVVWSQGRGDERFEERLLRPGLDPSPFETGTGQQVLDTFAAFPRNTLLVKLTYLLMR